jgi:hypothetical protein
MELLRRHDHDEIADVEFVGRQYRIEADQNAPDQDRLELDGRGLGDSSDTGERRGEDAQLYRLSAPPEVARPLLLECRRRQ